MIDDLTQNMVRSLFDYDAETGVLHRKRTGATGYQKKDGYIVFVVAGKNRTAHRLAWLYSYGYLPNKPYEIDHKNGNKADNRLENLRECTHSQNLCNVGPMVTNVLGIRGVYPYRGGKYCAQITKDKTQKTIGYYRSIDAAIAAREEAEKKYHGEYAP